MCGISGFIDFKKEATLVDLEKMLSTTIHRGPDDSGTFFETNEHANIGLGHNRLAIIDLTAAGHQPMHFHNLSIVFNGEIYNFEDVKEQLRFLGHSFVTNSDTEVILHAFSEWKEECVSRFIGMFAFAILDKKNAEVFFFRDRTGIKPLYYYWENELFLFASEVKPFHQFSRFNKCINMEAVSLYFDYGYVPAPLCIFKNCYKLLPGHFIRLDLRKKQYSINKYWDVEKYYKKQKLDISYEDAKEKLESLLESAFNYRMVADVPVGIFLSGGYDSTAVAAILQKNNISKIKTFTIGFKKGNNEAPFARKIAHYLGTEHTEYYCSIKDVEKILPQLPFYYDEPFADSSAIPTILVSQIARKNVTVSLSADGGDEIFAGYHYYRSFIKTVIYIRKLPKIFRLAMGYGIKLIYTLLPDSGIKFKFLRLQKALNADSSLMPYVLHDSYYRLPIYKRKRLFSNNFLKKTYEIESIKSIDETLSIALSLDYKMYLQNDILTKVDRATMSISLEGREPFLDHRIIEFVAQLPSEYKYGSTQKKILKDIVHKYVPIEMMNRPKLGFEMPVLEWLRGELSYLLDDYLSEESITQSGIFDASYIQRIKTKFLNGKENDPFLIWKIIQFQMWYRRWMC